MREETLLVLGQSAEYDCLEEPAASEGPAFSTALVATAHGGDSPQSS